ncbi:hypothetical protein NC651_007231 [Populus alba x Populus x berolinensis]|nr:hypothetical protein NC651_007231 [Populus alba x Populus x berolinensis]
MAPSRKQSNGRSPIVNPQRQITAFFSKTTTTTPSPSPSPMLSKKQIPKSYTKPNPSPSSRTQSPTPSPSPSTIAVYGKEVVVRRVRVSWPLDKSWYEGRVKSYDDESKKHLIQYDDSEEDLLDLINEKIEWGSLGFRKIVLEDDEMENVEGDNGGAGGGDDSSDEEWGKNAEKDVSEEEDVDLMDEEEADDGKKGKRGGKDSRKRKASGEGGKLDSGKSGGDASTGGVRVSVMDPVKNKESKERRDAKRRRPGDVDYDPRTLYLPAEFAKSLTETMVGV